jgi:hypothetical protein
VDKALWSTTSACASVPGSRVRPLTPDSAPKFGTPCLKNLALRRLSLALSRILKQHCSEFSQWQRHSNKPRKNDNSNTQYY